MQEFDPRRPALRFTPRIAVAAGGLLLLGLGWQMTEGRSFASAPPIDPAAIAALQHQAFVQVEAQPGFARPERVPVKVLPGETFAAAVQRAGVTAAEAQSAVNMLAQTMDTVNIKAGLAFDAAIARPQDDNGPARLIGLSMRTGPATAVTLSRTFDGALRLREMAEPVVEETAIAQGVMEGSLYQSAARAGATPGVTAEVVKLFAHRLDFSRDIKAGDEFRMVFDRKVTESGRTVETGNVLYAEIEAKGSKTRFYRFERANGDSEFFDETGKNFKGFLLRTPVDGARVTSTFGMRRHPILGYNRSHQGVDFGAGHGTPVLAAGDGVVAMAGRNGGYGNWLQIKHSGGWDTGYAHLSRFANGVRPGARVRQGQVVAYVGSTGMSTGPHLHYETFQNGRRVNPLSVKVPQGSTLTGAELAAFRAQKARVDTMLAQAGALPAQASAGETRKLAEADISRTQSGLRPAIRQ